MADRFFDQVAKALARVSLLLLAIAVVAWAIDTIPVFRVESIPSDMAAGIVAGEPYKSDELDAMVANLSGNAAASAFRASVLDARAIVGVRLAEDAVGSGDQVAIDARLDELARAADEALKRAPTNSFQWLTRLWVEQARGGSAADQLRSLRMSYMTGRNEAWIALRRNRLAFVNLALLPPDLVEAATAEFVGLVRSQLFSQAADILTGPAWPVRSQLSARLGELNEADRRAFARVLHDKEVEDVVVPGIAPAPQRPWH
jgi:hypothetical protein